MKITKQQLKEIIREEIQRLSEVNITGYYSKGKEPKAILDVGKLNSKSSLEKIIHAYIDAHEVVDTAEYASSPYDAAISDLLYLSDLLRIMKIPNNVLNNIYKKYSRDKKYPIITEQLQR